MVSNIIKELNLLRKKIIGLLAIILECSARNLQRCVLVSKQVRFLPGEADCSIPELMIILIYFGRFYLLQDRESTMIQGFTWCRRIKTEILLISEKKKGEVRRTGNSD